MARGLGKLVGKESDANQDRGSSQIKKEDPSPSPVNLGDQAGLKRGLDDCAVSTILDAGYEEEFFVSNVKIGLGSITIAIALLAQFYPKKYPDNWLILLLCLVFYGVGSAALSVFTSLAEEDSFLITKPKKVAGDLVLRLSSRLPRYSDEYKLVLDSDRNRVVSIANLWRHDPRKDSAILSRSLTEFYDDKGFLHEEKFAAEVQKLLTDFEKSYSNKLISGLEKGYKKVK